MRRKLFPILLGFVALAFAAPAAADRPTPSGFLDVFDDVNPCTGQRMIVTLRGDGHVHEHGDRLVDHMHRTITTSDGFTGRGTDSFVVNGKVLKFTFNDMMSNAAGDRFRAHGVIVIDVKTDTVRVERFTLTCLGN